jgi:hypothetical protein
MLKETFKGIWRSGDQSQAALLAVLFSLPRLACLFYPEEYIATYRLGFPLAIEMAMFSACNGHGGSHPSGRTGWRGVQLKLLHVHSIPQVRLGGNSINQVLVGRYIPPPLRYRLDHHGRPVRNPCRLLSHRNAQRQTPTLCSEIPPFSIVPLLHKPCLNLSPNFCFPNW